MGAPRKKSIQPHLGKLVLFEDDELFRMKLEKELKREDLEFTSYEDVKDTRERLASESFHAVLTDIYLNAKTPNGLDIVSAAKDEGLPCIIMTSALDLNIAKEGINRGADYILEKPFEISQLVRILKDIWENPRGLIGRRERCFDQHQLTPKEREFARMMLKGLSNKEIAEVLETTVATVKFYSNQIFSKLGVGSRGEFFNFVFPT